MDLAGQWRAAEADDELRRAYPLPEFDDSGWEDVAVPSHWRSSAAFAASDGPVLYRRAFAGGGGGDVGAAGGRRSWLVLDGVFYQSDVWLDGTYVGDTEGYFFPHAFEVTEALAARSEHVLAVEAACSRPSDLTAKRNLTGVFQHWDCLDPDWNPGGIWRGVRVEETGPVRISRLRVLCQEASAERAVVVFRATLDAAAPCSVVLRTRVGGTDHELEQPLAAGENRVTWTVGVARPALWWPHALGDQPLTDVSVEVSVAGDGDPQPSDRRSLQTGLRQVRMKDWVLSVNGERMFVKGSNQGPIRMALGEASADEFARDVQLAVDANLDMLRVHAHVSRPELYEAADHAGLLLWQDLPLQWGYARGVRKQAVAQAREAVNLLGHHPSVAVWCGHNEPMALDVEPGRPVGNPRLFALKLAAAQQLPTWNKTRLDSSLRRALERADESRPVVAHSGVKPHIGGGGTDSHLYYGWYHGRASEFPGALRRWPRLARFVSEFGAQAVPPAASFMAPEDWPDLDWQRLARTHALQKWLFKRHVPPASYERFEDWQRATQEYQADLLRLHIETLRRLKYRPTGGFCQFSFADGWPGVTWSVLDHERNPKLGYDALRSACAPVIAVADPLPEGLEAGDALALDVHVVSDLRVPLTGVVVEAVLSWSGGSERWAWTGDVPADSVVRVGTIQAVAPAAAPNCRLTVVLVTPTST
jgi:beta-mannosidase